MQFVREQREHAVEAVANRLIGALKDNQRVLWLVCGGSNISAEVEIMDMVRDKAGDKLAGLAVLPTDERYGAPGHADSNYVQMQQAGFDPGAATWIDVLMHDVPLAETGDFYAEVAAAAFANAGLVVAVFGMGTNCHIAGLQPGSPAVADDAADVVGFDWEDFTRLTLTANPLRMVHTAYTLVYGDKRAALERLQHNDEPYAELPAKLLYKLPESYVYNDYLATENKE